jgi:His-Xaa-Ser system protein HxsD
MADADFIKYEEMISQMFLDFKVRELVRKETEGIRNILYLKAFASCPDLEDLREDK